MPIARARTQAGVANCAAACSVLAAASHPAPNISIATPAGSQCPETPSNASAAAETSEKAVTIPPRVGRRMRSAGSAKPVATAPTPMTPSMRP